MLADPDKRFVQMLVGAFNDALVKEHGPQHDAENTRPLFDFGRELLGVPEQSGIALLWYGFYLGFGKGCEFMAIEQ